MISRSLNWVKKHFWKIAFYGLIFLFVSIMGSIMGIRYTERPAFCNSCHYMRPYYEAWKTSKHNNVDCVECHFEPGVLSTLEGKFKAITQIAKYITKTEGTRPWAEVSDNACLRSGCHEKRLIQGKVKFGNINFDHTPHLLENRRGKKLRCTSCHSQIMVGSHMAVTETTCFLCHFKGMPRGTAVGTCLSCHKLPEKEIVIQGVRFKHAEYIKEGATCDSCHLDVTQGDGNVPKERCVNCHGEPERLKRYSDTAFMHTNHVTRHKIECTQCHDQIEHGATKIRSSLNPNCNSCHGNMHSAQRDLFAGTGAAGVTGRPSPMFLARVECEGCHTVNEETRKSHYTGYSLVTKEISCMNCHGPSVYKILDKWKQYLSDRMTVSEKLLTDASPALGRNTVGADGLRIRKLYEDAQHNYDLLRYGRGVHNIEFARDLLDSIDNNLKTVMDPARPLAPLPRPRGENCTQLCHIQAPQNTLTFQGRSFPHPRHVEAAKLQCTQCHSAEVHKMTTVKPKDCDSCHHETHKDECLKCHAEQVKTVTSFQKKPFPHINHIQKAKLECAACHIADKDNKMIFRQDCTTCHEKKKPASHTTQWKSALHGKQWLNRDTSCGGCHKQSFCSNCHQTEMPHPQNWGAILHTAKAVTDRQICSNCHQQSFCVNCHSKTKLTTGIHTDCTSCHDPGTWKFKGAADSCLKCHKDKKTNTTPAKHAECIGCHKPHTWKPAPQPGLCAQCHKSQADLVKSAPPGMDDCSTCHQPHGWKFKGKDVCFDCHADVQKDIGKNNLMTDCFDCHKHHVWKIQKPIKQSTCGNCHQGMPGHDTSDFDNCTDCHKPHTWKP